MPEHLLVQEGGPTLLHAGDDEIGQRAFGTELAAARCQQRHCAVACRDEPAPVLWFGQRVQEFADRALQLQPDPPAMIRAVCSTRTGIVAWSWHACESPSQRN